MRTNYIRNFVIAVLTFSLLGVIGFIIWQKHLETMFNATIFKVTYQFMLMVLLGGPVSLFFKEYARERELRENKKSIQRKLYSDITKAYNSAKKVRRLIRAKALITNDSKTDGEGFKLRIVKRGPYEEQMEALNDIQLKFEFFRHEVESSPDLYKASNLSKHLRTIEKYLGKIVSEYESSLREFSGDPL